MAVSKIASIIAKKRLADIAKKKVAKVSAKDASEVAREARRPIGSTNRTRRVGGGFEVENTLTAFKRSGGTITTRPSKSVSKKITVKKITPPPGKRSIYQEKIKKAVREGTGVPALKGKKYTGRINPPGPSNRPSGLKFTSKIDEREPRPRPLSKLETNILREVGKRDYNKGGVNPLAFKVQQQEADRRVKKAFQELKIAEKKVKKTEKQNRRGK
jgi:hypothetical protein